MELCEHRNREHKTELNFIQCEDKNVQYPSVQEYSIPIFANKDFFFYFKETDNSHEDFQLF